MQEACDEHDVAWFTGSLVLAAHEGRKEKVTTKDHKYECTGCRGQLSLCRLTHHRFVKCACFRHKSHTPSCKGGGPETQLHYMCKYFIQEYVGFYDFCLAACKTPGCDTLGFVSKHNDQVKVEARLKLDGKLYVYDVLLFRKERPRLAIEILNTHKSDAEKISRTRQHGIEIVEIHVQDIVQRLEALKEARHRHEQGESVHVTLPNLLQRKELCVACCNLKALEMIFFEEVAEVHRYDSWLDALWWTHACEKHCIFIESCRVNRKRKLQRLAFSRAEQRQEENEMSYKKPKYEKGLMCKCPECEDWVKRDSCFDIRPESAGDTWFNKNKYHDHWKTVAVCARCAIKCEMCGNPMPLSQALRYGLCLSCNIVQ